MFIIIFTVSSLDDCLLHDASRTEHAANDDYAVTESALGFPLGRLVIKPACATSISNDGGYCSISLKVRADLSDDEADIKTLLTPYTVINRHD